MNPKTTILILLAAAVAAILVFRLVSREVTPEEFSDPARHQVGGTAAKP
jgi:hypothetical protein